MAYNFYPYPQQQMQSGFVSVRSIEEAYNWPVAPGNSITFKDENSPFVYTKTKGFSPLEQPVFERYKLVKVENPVNTPKTGESIDSQINLLWNEINGLKAQINGQKGASNEYDSRVSAVHEQPGTVHEQNEPSARSNE